MSVTDLASKIRTVNDFPKPGIAFKDITPLLGEPKAFRELVERMACDVKKSGAECVVGLEARGFILGVAVAMELGLPFIPARKPGKLPADTVGMEYDLEYGKAKLEIHRDALKVDQKVAIVDDLLATGGTAGAAGKLVEQLGAQVAGYFFAIELPALGGKAKLGTHGVSSVMSF
jgi:adenine phosphoribosyltransferase